MVLTAKISHTIDRFNPPNYTMNSVLLQKTQDIPDLGVTVYDTLTWSLHIYKMVNKSHSWSWLCMRALGFHARVLAKKTCYLTMVRSILEYCFNIWSPTFKYLILTIEKIQRRATNYILSNPNRPNPLLMNYKE